MKRTFPILWAATLLVWILLGPRSLLSAQQWEVCFTPGGNCTDRIIDTIERAHTSIYVQAYSFTSAPIAKALLGAHRRGVRVEVILDRSNQRARYSSSDLLASRHIPTYIDAEHAIAHNKVMIIDQERVITGSFNFTKAAQEHNAENLLIIHDQALAQHYFENWEMHRKHSKAYEGKNR